LKVLLLDKTLLFLIYLMFTAFRKSSFSGGFKNENQQTVGIASNGAGRDRNGPALSSTGL
jgi:hypothetical protein